MGRNIDDIIKSLPKERRDRIHADAEKLASEMIRNADSLNAFRKATGRTQAEVAKLLGIGQNAVSQLETRTDLYVSTLSKYVGALGMKLELSLRMPSGELVELPNFHPWDKVETEAALPKLASRKKLPPSKKSVRASTRSHRANASK